MDVSFYSAMTGAVAQQGRLDTLANNIANVNSAGYRTQDVTFANLVYQNIRQGGEIQQGAGTRVQRTNIDFGAASYEMTGNELDFAIRGNGFFAVRNVATGETLYTRSGSFIRSQGADGQFYLATASGERVLDSAGNPILLNEGQTVRDIGIYSFAHTEGFEALGNGLYRPGTANGAPMLNTAARLENGVLENANVDLTGQFSQLIETQRAFQMALRMLTTADELESVINNLR